MSGGPVLLAGLGLRSAWRGVRAVRRRQAPPADAVVAALALGAYLTMFRPWTRSWGATPEEVRADLPGDELVPEPGVSMTRAVTVDAPAEAVWPWLAQIGQDRGGFYSYTWLENLAGCDMHNADRVHDEWQNRSVGDGILLHPLNAVKLARFDHNHTFAFVGGWSLNLVPIDDGRRCRVIARSRIPRGLPSWAYAVFIEGPHFIMERKMLLVLKSKAETAPGAHLPSVTYGGAMQKTV